MNDSIWPWFDKRYKVYCETKIQYDQLMSWTGSEHGSVYLHPNGSVMFDVIISHRNYRRAIRFLSFLLGESHDPENDGNSPVDSQQLTSDQIENPARTARHSENRTPDMAFSQIPNNRTKTGDI